MNKQIKKITLITLATVLSLNTEIAVSAEGLSKSQRNIADTIAKVTEENWKEYGVLPSVAVAQAFVESSLGDHKPSKYNYNLWGIKSGAVWYDTVTEGTYGYMRVINNGYYKNAPYTTDYRLQLKRILAGGYCKPVGDYYSQAMYGYENYNFEKYDTRMFNNWKKEKARKKAKRRAAKRKARREKIKALREAQRISKFSETYTLVYDELVPYNSVEVDKNIIHSGTVAIIDDFELQGIYDVKASNKTKGLTIRINNPSMDGMKVKIEVKEHAKG